MSRNGAEHTRSPFSEASWDTGVGHAGLGHRCRVHAGLLPFTRPHSVPGVWHLLCHTATVTEVPRPPPSSNRSGATCYSGGDIRPPWAWSCLWPLGHPTSVPFLPRSQWVLLATAPLPSSRSLLDTVVY